MSEPSERRSGFLSRPPDREVGRRRRLSLGGSLLAHAVGFALFALIASVVPSTPAREGAAPAEIVTITRRTPRPAARIAAAPRRPKIARARPVALRVPVPPALPRAIPARSLAPVATTASRRRVAYAPRHRRSAREAPRTRCRRRNSARSNAVSRPTSHATGMPSIQPTLRHRRRRRRKTTGRPSRHLKSATPVTTTVCATRSGRGKGRATITITWLATYVSPTAPCSVKTYPGPSGDPKDDPFTGTSARDLPLAAPLPGWHLAQGEFVSPELREYAKDRGVVI